MSKKLEEMIDMIIVDTVNSMRTTIATTNMKIEVFNTIKIEERKYGKCHMESEDIRRNLKEIPNFIGTDSDPVAVADQLTYDMFDNVYFEGKSINDWMELSNIKGLENEKCELIQEFINMLNLDHKAYVEKIGYTSIYFKKAKLIEESNYNELGGDYLIEVLLSAKEQAEKNATKK